MTEKAYSDNLLELLPPFLNVFYNMAFSGTGGKEPTCQRRRCKRHGFNPWVKKIPWKRAWQPTPAFLLENPMDRAAWQATVHGIAELDMTEAT